MMSRQYSHRRFFRDTPLPLLGRYFQQHREVLQGFVFEEQKTKKAGVEALFAAYQELPEALQVEIEADFLNIDCMACPGGVTALVDESAFHQDAAFQEHFSAIEGLHAKVMWAFLEHRRYWDGAACFLESDSVPEIRWKRRTDIPPVAPDLSDEAIDNFGEAISDYFYTREAKGRNCHIDVYRRYGKEYLFAYPEDFALSSMEWIGKKLTPRASHPAFEIIFVYTQTEGALDIYAPRNSKCMPDLQTLFAQQILGLPGLDEAAADNRLYNLEPLALSSFKFVNHAGSGVEGLEVERIRLRLCHNFRRRILLETNPAKDPDGIDDLLNSLELPEYEVIHVGIRATLTPTPGNRTKTRSFGLSMPNLCNLRQDGVDLEIRKILVDSGIEPKAPAE